jgi:rhodanese-related sulfurtransferase
MEEITVAELAKFDGNVVVDVREPAEYGAGHVPGVINIPLSQLRLRSAEISASPVYVICQSGRRSAQATEVLGSMGTPAVNVIGGTAAWIAAGLPVEVA